jgi:hypothetical protein
MEEALKLLQHLGAGLYHPDYGYWVTNTPLFSNAVSRNKVQSSVFLK